MADDSTRFGGLTRRRFVRAAGATGAAGLLAGCSNDSGNGGAGGSGGSGRSNSSGNGGSGGAPSGDLTLSGWAADDTESELVKELLSEFESDHENINVEYNAVQSEYKQKMKTQLGAGNAPDVFYLDGSYFSSFASEGVLTEVDSLGNADDYNLDDFIDPVLDAFRYDGTLYGIPKDFSTLGLFHNTAMFEEAGAEVPESWSDLRSALETIDSNLDVDAPMIEFPNARIWHAMIYQNGGQVLEDDGSGVALASDASIEALQFLTDLKKDGLLAMPSEISAGWHGAAIGNEQVAVAGIGAWAFPYLEQDAPEVDKNVDVANLPSPQGGQKATTAFPVSYSIGTSTDSPEAAKMLVRELTSDEGMARWAEKGLALSARKSHADLEYYNENPRKQKMLEAGEWSHPFAYGPNSEAIMNRLNPELEGAMLGEQTAQEALENAQENINSEVFN
ncbi:hypothetical protein AUR64_14705 [Haloprofundus marisrubri]|uniref:Sugar ABC transporter substrate-binding protein n=1 Tax=Haloprofundus marisrubri TaxID=1514971 RepID=A0A0W1R6Q4_9EURY|nr:ABC transporter substrate-binding protein [Haloprofundus marisrubri]KTG09049.1 hypothetical protein AUR64_14705 [Haloprofundus marisrubri]